MGEIGRIFSVPWMLFGVVSATLWMTKVTEWMHSQKKKKRSLEKMIHAIFDSIDVNKDRHLSKSEFRVFCLLKFDMVKKEDFVEIDKIFEKIDSKCKNQLSFEDVTRYLDKNES